MFGHLEAQLAEVRQGSGGLAQIHCATPHAQQQHVVEQGEERIARLVYHHDHLAVLSGFLARFFVQ